MSLLEPENTTISKGSYLCRANHVLVYFETNFSFAEPNRVSCCDGLLDREDSNTTVVFLNEPGIFTHCIFLFFENFSPGREFRAGSPQRPLRSLTYLLAHGSQTKLS